MKRKGMKKELRKSKTFKKQILQSAGNSARPGPTTLPKKENLYKKFAEKVLIDVLGRFIT